MRIMMICRMVRYITMSHFLSWILVFLILEVNGIPGKSELRTKLLLQNIRTHLTEKADEIVQQKECESGLTLCKNTISKQLEKGDNEMPPPPKLMRGHKPFIKVSPKDVILTMMPKAHKKLFKKTKKFRNEDDQSRVFHQQIVEEDSKKKSEIKGAEKKFVKKIDNISYKQVKTQKQPSIQFANNINSELKSKYPTSEKTEEKMAKLKKYESGKFTEKISPIKVTENKEKEKNYTQKTKAEKLSKESARNIKEIKILEKEKFKNSLKPDRDKIIVPGHPTRSGIEAENEQMNKDNILIFPDDFFFAPFGFENLKSDLCKKHSQIYLKQLKKYKIWALMMYDASAKLPSGVLKGNINQYGDFDECLSINAIFKNIKSKLKSHSTEPSGIKGKYCLANIDISTNLKNSSLNQVLERVESFSFIRSTIFDPGHFIPRFSSINWGLCIPSTCPAEDVEKFFENYLKTLNNTSGLLFTIKVEEENCVVKDQLKFEFESATSIAIVFYVIVIGMTICGTYIDLQPEEIPKKFSEENGAHKALKKRIRNASGKEENMPEINNTSCKSDYSAKEKFQHILKAFSVKKNLAKLFSDNDTKDSIECISGIKSVFTIMLYFAHKTIPLGWTPFTNRIFFTKISNEASTVLLRTSIIYTDSFLLISGVLTSYNLSKEISKKRKISWVQKFIARFIRLTPALFGVVLFYAYVWNYLGSGPLWNLVVKKNSELCQKYLWRNLLYIQNLFPFEDMCAPQTHQLALDMQMSLLAPFFVYLLYNYDKVGVGILQAFFLLSSIMRYISTANNNLSVVIYHGMSVSQLYKTANLLYAQTLHRASPYLMGSIVGFYLNKFEKNNHIPKAFAALGWIIAFSLGFYCIVSPSHLSQRNYHYDVHEAAQYAALTPVAWSFALAWLIVACHFGYGGKLNEFLSNKSFLVFSRISYSVYLTQFLIFFYRIGVKRIPEMFTFGGSFNVTEFFIVIFVSVTVTFLFDFPMIEIRRIILNKKIRKPDTLLEETQAEEKISEEPKNGSQIDEDSISQEESFESQDITDEMNYPEDMEEGDENLDDENTSEEDDEELPDEGNENEPLRRSTRIYFDEEPDNTEWLKIENENDESEENFK